jgi:hypothetical protein
VVTVIVGVLGSLGALLLSNVWRGGRKARTLRRLLQEVDAYEKLPEELRAGTGLKEHIRRQIAVYSGARAQPIDRWLGMAVCLAALSLLGQIWLEVHVYNRVGWPEILYDQSVTKEEVVPIVVSGVLGGLAFFCFLRRRRWGLADPERNDQVRLAGIEPVARDSQLPVGGRTYSELATATGLTASAVDDVADLIERAETSRSRIQGRETETTRGHAPVGS